jgi:hypothetical protein
LARIRVRDFERGDKWSRGPRRAGVGIGGVGETDEERGGREGVCVREGGLGKKRGVVRERREGGRPLL